MALFAVCLWANSAIAQRLATEPIRKGDRLSDWILRQGLEPSPYYTGLLWGTIDERPKQAELQRDLIAKLGQHERVAIRTRLVHLLESLPVTGRVPLARPDARWLQANPQYDPMLKPGDLLVLPNRPVSVIVITQDASICELDHVASRQAVDYLMLCETSKPEATERLWVIQPDGYFNTYGIAMWNQEAQDEPAPGALIWAPGNDWPPSLSKMVVQFLATQSYETVRTTPSLKRIESRNPSLGSMSRMGRGLPHTSNDFGLIGLMQTPSARMADAGEIRFHVSRIEPYERFNVFFQPFDALELGFRYTNVLNRAYGPQELSGNQTFKDKSLDFKFRLREESALLPQLAIGVTDIGGTGLFSSEYLVASKRWHAFDFSLGIGWGNMASSGSIGNPLAAFDKRFKARSVGSSFGGTPNTSAFFRGPSALFGGLQYHTPWSPLVLKLELDGNNYRDEPLGNSFDQRSSINLGLVYRYHPQVDFTLGLERGNALMLGLTLHTSMSRMHTPKVSDPPAIRPNSRPIGSVVWSASAGDLQSMSAWGIRRIESGQGVLRVFVDNASGAHWNDRLTRMTAVLNRDAPAEVTHFEIVILEQGVPMSKRVVDRQAWLQRNTELLSPSGHQADMVAINPDVVLQQRAEVLWDRPPSTFGYSLVPILQQNFGGPDGFLLFSVGASLPFRFSISERNSIDGALNLKLVDNFEKFKYTAPSELPRVRTFLREYMTSSALTLPYLQMTHFGQLARNQYYSLYGGYLESMYGGVGGEWLYRPWHSPLSFGIDLNRVQQRDFRQALGFGNAASQTGYRVTTGHASAYWETGWQSTLVKLSAGRYLARDIGATLDVSRTFNNGIVMGAWATKTDVSAQRFGEGSFDKGLYLRIPFDVMTTTRTGNVANLVYNPLTRDGGARLNRSFMLYYATMSRSERETALEPAVKPLR